MSLLLLLKNSRSSTSGQATLYVGGHQGCVAQGNLYAAGLDVGAAGLTLFVDGVAGVSGGVNLVTAGRDVRASEVPLTAFGGGRASANAPLVTNGVGYVAGQSTLVTVGPAGAAGMNIFLKAAASDATLRSMNLWLRGTPAAKFLPATLFLRNTSSALTGQSPLFMPGGGDLLSAGMVLFLRRLANEYASDLFLQGQGAGANSLCDLLVQGFSRQSQSSTLVIPSVVGFISPSEALYTHGW